MTPQVEQFLRDFKSCQYYCRRIIWLNQKLEVLDYELAYGRHSGFDLTEEQLRSPWPMPRSVSMQYSAIDWQVWEEKENVLAEIEKYRIRILECRKVELLSSRDFGILADRYWFGIPVVDVAEKYAYSINGLYKHIDCSLKWVLKAEKFFTSI